MQAALHEMPSPGMTFIYGICDPRTNELRYVGKTKARLSTRLSNHMKLTSGKNHRCYWFAKMNEEKVYPVIFQLEEVEDWKEAERFWIANFRALGCRLVNTTFGGDGLSGAGPTSFKKGHASHNKGKKSSVETRAKIGAASRRYKHKPWTEEQKARHRETMKRVHNFGPAREKLKVEGRSEKTPEAIARWKTSMRKIYDSGWNPRFGGKISVRHNKDA